MIEFHIERQIQGQMQGQRTNGILHWLNNKREHKMVEIPITDNFLGTRNTYDLMEVMFEKFRQAIEAYAEDMEREND